MTSGFEQARIQWSAVPVDDVLKSSDTLDDLKSKLQLVQEVKAFAEIQLQIKPTPNFTTYMDLKRPYVSYLLTASRKDELKAYQWHFPLFGSFPYLGFFDEHQGKAEQERLEKTGEYDTYLRGVRAYSTLGWLRDPILSSMTNASEEQIVETVVHECIHAELWVPSSVSFNEQLAVFLADRGKELFYRWQRPDPKRIERIVRRRSESLQFSKFLERELEDFAAFLEQHRSQKTPLSILDTFKAERYREIKSRFSKLGLESFGWFEDYKLNTASLVALRVYLGSQDKLEKAYLAMSNGANSESEERLQIKKFLDWLRMELNTGKTISEILLLAQ